LPCFPAFRRSGSGGARSAFFSFDAAFAILLAVIAFTSFGLLQRSAVSFAADAAQQTVMVNRALRLSSYIVNEAGVPSGGAQPDTYVESGQLDVSAISRIDLQTMAQRFGVDSASITVRDESSTLFSSPPLISQQPYCVQRLALASKDPIVPPETVVVEVCVT